MNLRKGYEMKSVAMLLQFVSVSFVQATSLFITNCLL